LAANGFAWKRFCIVWAAFVFVFFSLSGSKLPSYILPMFPALALVLGSDIVRLSPRALMWIAMPLAVGASVVLLAHLIGYDRLVSRLADSRTPAAIYFAMRPWLTAAFVTFAAAGAIAVLLFRRATPATTTLGIVALSVLSLLGLQFAFQGHDAFRIVRSAHDVLAAAERANGGPLDPAYPVYQVEAYDQTLPFYLGRPTPPVAYRDEMDLGLAAEPHKGHQEADWRPIWQNATQAYALMEHATATRLVATGLPMRELARDPRRVFVARR
jgi:4-amino-4-deoxy-L-arabinose transferase-like glycosyltransferase